MKKARLIVSIVLICGLIACKSEKPVSTPTATPTALATITPTATPTPVAPTMEITMTVETINLPPLPTLPIPVPTQSVTTQTTRTSTSPTKNPYTTLVWAVAGGAKYHSNPDCSNMKYSTQMTLAQALQQGLTPCEKCY